MNRLRAIEDAISADEIGIATARFRDVVLRSAFQLVYAPDGSSLRPVAAEGFVRPYHDGIALSPQGFLAGLGGEERLEAERICMVLHARNHRHFAGYELGHVAVVDRFTAGGGEVLERALLAEPASAAAHVIGRIREPASFAAAAVAPLVAMLRGQGMQVAMGGLGTGHAAIEEVRAARPDIVHFDGAWFRRVAASRPALRLLSQLVDRLREEGARIMVSGIETRAHLLAALSIGADLLQGFLLARPILAGATVDLSPRALEVEAGGEREIRLSLAAGRT